MWHHRLLVFCGSISCYYNLEMLIHLRDDACIMLDMIMLVQLIYDTDRL
jgi:hypothetical protein